MKRIYFIILFICLVALTGSAQQDECWNNPNTITTKWNEPNTANTENWDWTKSGLVHPVYLKDNMTSPSILVELPYFCTKPGGSGSCNNDNTYCYEVTNLITGRQDIYPQDGWELLLKDFGTPTVGSTIGRKTANPVFILYNKYTGKMKVYLAVIGNKTANSAYIQLHFEVNSLKNGIYTHADAVCKTLLDFDTESKFRSLNSYALQNNEDDYQWLVSEIQTAYDPCVCTSISNTRVNTIEILPELIANSTITADIEGTAVQDMMNGGGVQAEADGKTSFKDVAIGAGTAAIKGYNDFSSYKSQLDKMLDKSNQSYKNKLVTEWFDDYVKKNPQYQGVNNLSDKYNLWDALGRTDDAYKRSIGIDKIDAYQTSSNFRYVKSIASFIPYVGSAIGLIDFFVNGGKEQDPPKPSPPMVFNVSLKLNGSISLPSKLTPVHFLLPGSRTNVSSNLLPIYNNILGVFNILKPPAFEAGGIKPKLYLTFLHPDGITPYRNVVGIKDFDNTIIQNGRISTDPDGGDDLPYSSMGNLDAFKQYMGNITGKNLLVQYKLREDMKYMVNPAANLTVEMIDACFVIEYKSPTDLYIKDKTFVDGTNYKDIGNEQAFPFHRSMFSPSLTFEQRLDEIAKTGLDLEYISADKSIIKFRTKYVPLTCLKNESFTLYNGLIKPKVYVKMLVKYKRNDEPTAELITQIVTYDISSSFYTPLYVASDCSIAMRTSVTASPSFLDLYPGDQANWSHYDDLYRSQDILPNFYFKNIFFRDDNSHDPNCYPFTSFSTPMDHYYYSGMPSQKINGTLFVANNKTITSNTWLKARKIVLGNNITINDNVELVAEEPIELPEESTMNPNSIISAEPFSNLDLWSCPDVNIATLHATDDEIKALCENSIYKAKAQSFHKGDDFIENKLDTTTAFGFTLFPNPAQNNISITVACSNEERIKLSVVDITGKEVSDNLYVENVLNGSVINVDLTSLSSGIYFCSLINNAGVKMTQKFIIAK